MSNKNHVKDGRKFSKTKPCRQCGGYGNILVGSEWQDCHICLGTGGKETK